jgi:hypothetical protein
MRLSGIGRACEQGAKGADHEFASKKAVRVKRAVHAFECLDQAGVRGGSVQEPSRLSEYC